MKDTVASYSVEIVARAVRHGERVAIVDGEGEVSYHDLVAAAHRAADCLLANGADLAGARVALLAPPGRDYVIAQWGTWLAGGVIVPLCLTHPLAEMAYMVGDAEVSVIVAHPQFEAMARELAATRSVRVVSTLEFRADSVRAGRLPEVGANQRAMIIYTSGTTGKPKGVVTTHRNIAAQITALIDAWEWRPGDRILHVLPLHHLHGVINVLGCALWAGAVCEMHARFEARAVWERIARGGLTLFMAVPVIYQRLIAQWDEANPEERAMLTRAASALRLMVCGSAALPVPVFEKWREVSGQFLLERYGMTEIGMALSNPLHGPRLPGTVGVPLSGVLVRLVDEAGAVIEADDQPGEIEVAGPAVFLEYWRRPAETLAAFHEGWFRTGDIARRRVGIYAILGRNSVDIIKTGAYKVSALEIEHELLAHPAIEECAVVGVPDDEWGERVCAVINWRGGAGLSLEELRAWCKERLAVYKVPSRVLSNVPLPRNALGKVTKKDVQALFKCTP
ncbi:MAG: AMP-binding protein [Opitutae bacterium]|nr:AMP-binding protein [Opitutae bacterium]